MKRTGLVCILLLLCFCSLPLAAANEEVSPFTDLEVYCRTVPEYQAERIRHALACNFFSGVSASQFDPQGPMTREMFVTVLGRVAEDNGLPVSGEPAGFSDVRAGAYYEKYINWGVQNGIVKSYGKEFGVGDPVTRQQAAALIDRFARNLWLTLPAMDDAHFVSGVKEANIGQWAYEACERVISSGIVPMDMEWTGGSYIDPETGGLVLWDGVKISIAPRRAMLRAEAAYTMARLDEVMSAIPVYALHASMGRGIASEAELEKRYPLVVIATPDKEAWESENSIGQTDWTALDKFYMTTDDTKWLSQYTKRTLTVLQVLHGELKEEQIVVAEPLIYGKNENGRWREYFNLSGRAGMWEGENYLLYLSAEPDGDTGCYTTSALDGVYSIRYDGRLVGDESMDDEVGMEICRQAQSHYETELN